ncbi:hypothetical protein [Xenorhabdus szentirmaii]|uniref:hypothetical protein n=1 Tax=Xenorhabdus szentirmaii TaxID=290112 RepID=UPI002B40DCA7|nr:MULTISPECIES: hypothetical protein [unclassified Xenorhabdus]
MKTTHQVVTKNLTTQDYNYRHALTPLFSRGNAAPNDPLTVGEMYRYAEPYRNAGLKPILNRKAAVFLPVCTTNDY